MTAHVMGGGRGYTKGKGIDTVRQNGKPMALQIVGLSEMENLMGGVWYGFSLEAWLREVPVNTFTSKKMSRPREPRPGEATLQDSVVLPPRCDHPVVQSFPS